MLKWGIVADTHGLLRPELVAALAGVDHILHAGDVGSEPVLEGLRQVAPVTAVRGNVDTGLWATSLPESVVVELPNGHSLFMLHIFGELEPESLAAEIQCVVFGHSHRPEIGRREGLWTLNPGSAGPRRFRLPVSFMTLTLRGAELRPELHELDVSC